MANPSISFNDGSGTTTITSLTPRLGNWTPLVTPIGPNAVALGSGVAEQWTFRADYGASFEMANVPASSLADLQRLRLWLVNGGTMTVNTNDLTANSYTVQLKEASTTPSWTLDRALLEYTVSFEVVNTSAAPMTCVYR
jgi:hypothetical protein